MAVRPSSWTLSALCPRIRGHPGAAGTALHPGRGFDEFGGAHLSEPAAWDFPPYTHFCTDSGALLLLCACMVRVLSACLI